MHSGERDCVRYPPACRRNPKIQAAMVVSAILILTVQATCGQKVSCQSNQPLHVHHQSPCAGKPGHEQLDRMSFTLQDTTCASLHMGRRAPARPTPWLGATLRSTRVEASTTGLWMTSLPSMRNAKARCVQPVRHCASLHGSIAQRRREETCK